MKNFSTIENTYINEVLIPEMKKQYIDDEKTLITLIDYKIAHIRNLELRIEAARRMLEDMRK